MLSRYNNVKSYECNLKGDQTRHICKVIINKEKKTSIRSVAKCSSYNLPILR